MNITLNKLVHVYRDQLDEFDPETGELTADLSSTELAIHGKALAVAAYIQQNEAEASMVESHAKMLLDRVRKAKARSKWLRGYLGQAMLDASILELAADDLSLVVRVQPDRDESVEISPDAILPPELMRTRIVSEPDKILIRRAIIDGQPLPEGVQLVRKPRLTIK